MQPQMATKIEKSTRKHFPDGIAAYGTDSLRFTFAQMATQGRDIRFDVGRIEGYRNFCNKLWNATRFVMMSAEAQNININEGDKTFGLAECWINTRLAGTLRASHEGMRTYRFDLASQALYEFTWDEYCDWYLELAKTTLNNDNANEAEKRGTLYTLLNVLENLLRALHPFIPFITETLWQRTASLLLIEGDTIMLQRYPVAEDVTIDENSVNELEWVKSFIMGVRRIRAERDIAPGKKLNVFIKGGTANEQQWLQGNVLSLKKLGRIDNIELSDQDMDDAVMALAGDMRILIPLADIIEPATETKRLQKTIEKLEKEKAGLDNQLSNSNFVERAPTNVVEGVKARQSEITNELVTYQEQLAVLAKMVK